MKIPFKISSIFGGLSICDYFNIAGQIQASVGIDPDMPATDDGDKPSGYIRPTKMVQFSETNVNATPLFIITNPKTTTVYVILSNGRIISYNSSLAGETIAATLTEAAGNGARYYDNYVYVVGTTDVSRFGPLNGSPIITQSYWQTSLSLVALSNTTYPSINGVVMPNHNMHRHTDDKLYFCDVFAVAGTSQNKGILNYIKTTKTTVEGDTNDSSAYNALDFDFGIWPTCIETYQTDLVIGLIEGVSTSTKQKPAKLSFWDTTSASFTNITDVELSDPLITTIKNINGTLYVFSGFATGGCRVSKIVSGYSLDEVVWLPEQFPPISSEAVDHILNRFVFGSNTVEPEIAGAVFSIGAKEKGLAMGLQVPLKATSTGNNPIVTAVKYVEQNGKIVQPICGWKDDSGYGLDKITTGSTTDKIRLEVIIPESYGSGFKLKMLKIPFVQKMAANMGFTIKVYADNANDSRDFTVGNSGGVSGKYFVKIYPEIEITNNFFIQLEFQGSELLTIALPIMGVLETTEA